VSAPFGLRDQVVVASERARLWDAGLRPVPVYNADSLRTSSPGKAPMGDDWQELARRNPPEAAEAAVDPDATNSGVLCDGLRAVDIDVGNPTICASVLSKIVLRFGEAPRRYRNDSPRCLLLYRAAEGEPEKRVLPGAFGKIEVLGRGQQFVAFGWHPDGEQLRWTPEAPCDISLNALPVLSEPDIDELFTLCGPSINAQAKKARSKGPGRAAGGTTSKLGLTADTFRVLAAVHAIPNDGPPDWEAWDQMGRDIWAATQGNEAGRSLFHAWGERHSTYDPVHTNERWDHYPSSPPAERGAGSIFKRADEALRAALAAARLEPAASRAERSNKALSLLLGAGGATGSPADAYLSAIALPGLAASRSLMFRADCPHPGGARQPALLAVAVDVNGEPAAIGRTFLRHDAAGLADVAPVRAHYGPLRGAAVRLDPPAPELVIGVDIEEAASLGRLLSLPAWAAVTQKNLAYGLALPKEVHSVVIAGAHDEEGRNAAKLAQARWLAEGIGAIVKKTVTPGQSFNDLLRSRAHHA
jgi:hypothetical protein